MKKANSKKKISLKFSKKQQRAKKKNQNDKHSYEGSVWGNTAAGGGSSRLLESPREWRGSTRQVCGLWPFVAGSTTHILVHR